MDNIGWCCTWTTCKHLSDKFQADTGFAGQPAGGGLSQSQIETQPGHPQRQQDRSSSRNQSEGSHSTRCQTIKSHHRQQRDTASRCAASLAQNFGTPAQPTTGGILPQQSPRFDVDVTVHPVADDAQPKPQVVQSRPVNTSQKRSPKKDHSLSTCPAAQTSNLRTSARTAGQDTRK